MANQTKRDREISSSLRPNLKVDPSTGPPSEIIYDVYEWHLGGDLLASGKTADQVLEMEYRYSKFDKERKRAWVTNCCDFKVH